LGNFADNNLISLEKYHAIRNELQQRSLRQYFDLTHNYSLATFHLTILFQNNKLLKLNSASL